MSAVIQTVLRKVPFRIQQYIVHTQDIPVRSQHAKVREVKELVTRRQLGGRLREDVEPFFIVQDRAPNPGLCVDVEFPHTLRVVIVPESSVLGDETVPAEAGEYIGSFCTSVSGQPAVLFAFQKRQESPQKADPGGRPQPA